MIVNDLLLRGGGGNSRWQRLRDLLATIRDRLREAAGERERGNVFTPDDFFVVGLRKAEPKPPRRPPPPPGSEGEEPGSSVESDPDAEAPERGKGKARPKGGTGGPSLSEGTVFRVKTSVRPERNQRGEFDTLRVVWRMPEDARLPEMVGVRVCVPSGSDVTCEQPLGPQWLRLKQIAHPSGTVPAGGDGAFELLIPPASGELAITLAQPVADPNAVEIDARRRNRREGGDDD